MPMTNTKKIVGDIGIGGLGYVNAVVMSRTNRIYSPIRLCVDTGCSVTIISHLDALRIGLIMLIIEVYRNQINRR